MINLLPKDTVFYDLFEKLANNAVLSTQHLQKLVKEFPNVEPAIALIRRCEHDADDVAHVALDRLDRTFITPFDREDIHDLVNCLDDIVDMIDALAKRFVIYHVKTLDPDFQKQVDTLGQAARAVDTAIHLLRKSRKLTDLSDALVEIHRLENQGDENNHAAISRLFAEELPALHVIKWKELYDRIERAIDKCEDLANMLERIVLKNG